MLFFNFRVKAMIPYYVMTTKGGKSKGESSQKAFARMPPTEKVELRELVEDMVRKGSVASKGLMKGFLCDVFESLVYFLLEGRRVTLGEIGSFSLSLKSEATASADEFNKDNIKGVNVVFTPSREMKECLANAVFKRISIEEKDHDAIINYLLKNEGYEEKLEEHRALCDSCD